MPKKRTAPPSHQKNRRQLTSSDDDVDPPRRHVAVIVLGDLGRSPRMQYHALSLLEHGHIVSLVGYAGEDLIPQLEDSTLWAPKSEGDKGKDGPAPPTHPPSRLNVIRISPPCPPRSLRRGPLLPIYLALRLVGLLCALIRALWFSVPRGTAPGRAGAPLPPPVDCVLVQNPPSIPLLLLSYLFCLSRPLLLLPRPGLVVDWHNLGYTMFDLSDRHPIRLLARTYERIMAPRADGHLCVTEAMRRWLERNFAVGSVSGGESNVAVLHDKPPQFFKPTGLKERHNLMMKLAPEFRRGCPRLCSELGCGGGGDDENDACDDGGGRGRGRTLFTERAGDAVRLRSDRPALVISSTSWTPDEDFSVLLDACVRLDGMARRRNGDAQEKDGEDRNPPPNRFPHVVVIVTGKGPQKSSYEERISRLNLSYVCILTMWLEAADYPTLLGCADLGVSLHTSTSGIDLPMKVLDMFGCEVPVCALNFSCLHELVKDGTNGRVFDTAEQLAGQMLDLLGTISDEKAHSVGELARLRRGIKGMTRWRENWTENARSVIMASCSAELRKRRMMGEPPMWLKLSALFLSFVVAYCCTKLFLLS